MGCRVLLPARHVHIAGLHLLSFSAGNFCFFDHRYFRFASFMHLRELTVNVLLGDSESPVILPAALSSSSLMTKVELYNCFPQHWDAPMFGPRLKRLSMSYVGDFDVPHLMPTTLEFSRILTSTPALQSLVLDNIHLQSSAVPYPAMELSPELSSIDIFSWRDHTQHRACLAFLENLVFQRRGIQMEISLGNPDGASGDDSADDANSAKDILSLIRSALQNIYRQQADPPKHIVLGHKAFLTHDSETSRSKRRAWPISVMQYMFTDIPGVTSILNFDFDISNISDTTSLYEGSVPIPLRDLRSVSLNCSGGWAYLESEIWWRAMKEAVDVRRIAVYFSDCAKLLPLAETEVNGGASVFAAFPHLKIIHVHLEEVFIADDSAQLDEAGAVCTELLTALQFIARVRREHGEKSRLESLVVDSVLSGWEIWKTIAEDVPVSFCDFHSHHRDAA
ncbi:unnamed protein product [Peniophora sp. CBMAI 1063]|nr:unnamed protein product [Peniophora sp. CBMAI 1063]